MRRFWIFLIAALLMSATVRAEGAELVQFESTVRPILKAHCFQCHGDEENPQGRLDLRLVRWMLRGGESGPALVPGRPQDSLLYQRIAAGEMPPKDKKLSDQERATVLAWIEQGARTAGVEPETLARGADWTESERAWWAFQPVAKPAVPTVKQPELIRTPIDAFLLAALESRGRSFSPPAERSTLIRRLYFDLLGLPPPPEHIMRFANDESPDAYERLVDELLASPAYGERWARHWLDVAGYADSDGYTELDPERPWAFRYRDYVIRSLNDDKPLDQFIVEQLAGDELLTPPYANLQPADADKLVATGFLRMAPDGTGDGGVDQNEARNAVVAETIKIVSSSLLGMTVGCAQCHNHRYDPISQADYYRFRAIFEPALDWKNWRPPGGRLISLWGPAQYEQAAVVDAKLRELETQRAAELTQIVAEIFEKQIALLEEALREPARAARAAVVEQRTLEQQQILKDYPSLNVDGGSAYLYEPERLREFNERQDKLAKETRDTRPPEDMVAGLTEVPGQLPATQLFYRGDINQPREELPPGDLSVLGERAGQVPVDDPEVATSGRRLAFARHLTSGKHPLLGRVLVNRVWMHHFGRGLVATPADFGYLGERPSHPELLDWLADDLVQGGWSLKRMHRMLVTSTAYRQSSRRTPELDAIDPDNRLLGRMPVRRMEAEAIRDAVLSIAGVRTDQMFGPAIPVFPDDVGQVLVGKGLRDGNGILQGDFALGPDLTRRSIYVQVRRSLPLGMLEPFDAAATAPNCELRTSSTVAPQSLLLMNNQFVVDMAQQLAKRVTAEAGSEPAAQARRSWLLAFGRDASETKVATAVGFLSLQRSELEAQPPAATAEEQAARPPADLAALATFCQALFCSNRFLYVD